MTIHFFDASSFGRELEYFPLLGDASLQGALDGVSREIIGSELSSIVEQSAGFFEPQFGQNAKVSSVDRNIRHGSGFYRKTEDDLPRSDTKWG